MPNSFHYMTISQAEIDRRSREARRHLEDIEALLVPGIRTTRWWISLSMPRLKVRIRRRSERPPRETESNWEKTMRNPRSACLQALTTRTASGWISRRAALRAVVSAGGFALSEGAVPGHGLAAHAVGSVDARVIAVNIPGASSVARVGTFLNDPAACARPIPANFPTFIQPGAVLDPARLLVGSASNFGAPLAPGAGQGGSFLSIDPNAPDTLAVPSRFASNGMQASALGGRVQMFSANSPHWTNRINNPMAATSQFTGASNPLGLSNNNAFGRVWPANAPFGDSGFGSSTILDPTGLPLKGAPSANIGGVYAGALTNRNPQIISGALSSGAVGTAFLGPSPDQGCRAVFSVVTADGAIVQEHTQKGLDGLAPAGTVQPLVGLSWDPPNKGVEPRLGVLMSPYVQNVQKPNVVQQLFVSEPFNNTIAVIDLVVTGLPGNEVFAAGDIRRINSPLLNLPVDLAPADIETTDIRWASNTTLEKNADFYVANRGDNTILRMRQDGTFVALQRVNVDRGPLNNASLNGIATSPDGMKIYVTMTGPGNRNGGVLELPAFE
jgi:hypothetical protein